MKNSDTMETLNTSSDGTASDGTASDNTSTCGIQCCPPNTVEQIPQGPSVDSLCNRFLAVRNFSATLCEPLETEDFVIQTIPDVSPTRWHLAHTTWFFETFLLKRYLPDYEPCNPAFEYLFNSYYNQVGEQFPRGQRGWLSRPTVDEVFNYRQQVNERVVQLLSTGDAAEREELNSIVELGLQHEQQHQELLLMDIKHVFASNPLFPVYREPASLGSENETSSAEWVSLNLDREQVGAELGFAFDNEYPRHEVLLRPFQLQNRLVTNGEFLEFVNDQGYQRPELWLSLGWHTIQSEGWQAPLYWFEKGGEWFEFTLGGLQPLNLQQPVAHVSYFEADAYARWAEARLPTEFEWEVAASQNVSPGNFVESAIYHPQSVKGDFSRLLPAECDLLGIAEPTEKRTNEQRVQQMFGDLWEWTSSPYVGYPGYEPPQGAIGEYNGKFMCNQFVLRGGACVSSAEHVRLTYRNFFAPECRWQFAGIRLARV